MNAIPTGYRKTKRGDFQISASTAPQVLTADPFVGHSLAQYERLFRRACAPPSVFEMIFRSVSRLRRSQKSEGDGYPQRWE